MCVSIYIYIYKNSNSNILVACDQSSLFIWSWINENQQALKDLLHVPVEPITRARSKKIKEALNGLIQEILADSNTSHAKLGPKEDEVVINLIQVIKGWSSLNWHDLWCALMTNWLSSSILINRFFSFSGDTNFRPNSPWF